MAIADSDGDRRLSTKGIYLPDDFEADGKNNIFNNNIVYWFIFLNCN